MESGLIKRGLVLWPILRSQFEDAGNIVRTNFSRRHEIYALTALIENVLEEELKR